MNAKAYVCSRILKRLRLIRTIMLKSGNEADPTSGEEAMLVYYGIEPYKNIPVPKCMNSVFFWELVNETRGMIVSYEKNYKSRKEFGYLAFIITHPYQDLWEFNGDSNHA